MLITLLSWLVILFMAFAVGSVFICFAAPDAFSETSRADVSVVMGLLVLNAYAQVYSIFAGVGKGAFCLAFAAAVLCIFFTCFYINKKRTGMRRAFGFGAGQMCMAAVAVLLTGLFTMKAPSHVDTYLYHAQTIRWIEEYGVVPGLGNLHNRFAYNSAFMPLQALFSFAWILEEPLHSLNGFLCCFFVCYALLTNRIFTGKSRLSDFLKLIIPLYVFLNRNHISSPGSDLSAMLLVLYINCKWSECMERKEKDIQSFGAVCLICAWAVTIKLSAAVCLLFVIYPAVILIREKRRRTIVTDLVCGIVTAAPWLVRNVIISGYLLYPYAGIDLFGFDWKMPASLLEYDRREIIVWGREIKDVSRFEEPITQWFGTWFGSQMARNKILILAGFAATIILAAVMLFKLSGIPGKRNRLQFFLKDAPEWLLVVTAVTSEIFWLFSAPLLRYGMVYLLMPAAVVLYLFREALGRERFRRWTVMGAAAAVCLIIVYKDEDFRAVMPHGYWRMDNTKQEWHSFEIYSPVEDSLSGYYDFPAVAREEVLDEIMPRGNKIEDGFAYGVEQ